MSTPFLPYGRQAIDDDDIAAVAAVLRSDALTSGPEVDRFEEALAKVTGAAHAVSCNFHRRKLRSERRHLLFVPSGKNDRDWRRWCCHH
jgi:hypothetical protein